MTKKTNLPNSSPKQTQLPRGIRNNNPLNIRIGNVWLGEVQFPNDPAFEQFVNMRYGLRAAFILMRRYINHYKRTTIPEIISAWAPSTENNTVKYVDMVCQLSGLAPAATLDYADKPVMCRLVAAMAQVECGQSISDTLIEQAYDIA